MSGRWSAQPPDAFEAARPDTILVSVMMVNNGSGVIRTSPLGESAAKGIIFHVDAAQATGKSRSTSEAEGGPDVVLGAQSVTAPKGIGALYVRRKPRAHRGADARRRPTKRGFRSGTLAHQSSAWAAGVPPGTRKWAPRTSACACCATACWPLLAQIESVCEQQHMAPRAAQNLNISFNYVEGESLIMAIKELAFPWFDLRRTSLEPS